MNSPALTFLFESFRELAMMSEMDLILITVVIWGVLLLLRIGKREAYLPPGPATLPVIGNLHVFPNTAQMHVKFAEWARRYGAIFSLKASSQTIIILSSATAVRNVVDRTGWKISSRPPNYLAGLVAGPHWIPFMPDNPDLRHIRTILGTYFSRYKAAKTSTVPAESVQLLHELITNPSDFKASVRRFTHSTTKTLSYGKRAPVFNCPDLAHYYETLDEGMHIISPGVYPPIDLIPVLKYLPACIAPWQSASRAVYEDRLQLQQRLYEEVKTRADRQMGADRKEMVEEFECFVGWLIKTHSDVSKPLGSAVGLVLVDGGSDTTSAFLLSVLLALASHTEYQHHAFVELTSVVGDKLPEQEDIKRMPFVHAFIKEIMRLRPILPLGIPHAASDNLEYEGYVIPKGCTVIMNIYAMNHDPLVFEEPESFKPERFLMSEFGTMPGKDEDFRQNFMFGGGRRICPGQWIARNTIELVTMRLIWAFEFSDAVDAKSKQAIPSGLGADLFVSEFMITPRPFECVIKPREGRAPAIRDHFLSALEDLKKYEVDLSIAEREYMKQFRSCTDPSTETP